MISRSYQLFLDIISPLRSVNSLFGQPAGRFPPGPAISTVPMVLEHCLVLLSWFVGQSLGIAGRRTDSSVMIRLVD